MLDSKGFDLWADGYDKSVNLSEEANTYPFAGYKNVLNTIYNQIKQKQTAKILDIGFGTAVLSQKLYDERYEICGIDFSEKMLDIAKGKMANARLIQYDFKSGLPRELEKEKFDYIVCTYVIHHLNDNAKVSFIKELMDKISSRGKLVVGDVAFETINQLEECRNNNRNEWDFDEFYPEVEVFSSKFDHVSFYKISFCSGVITFTK